MTESELTLPIYLNEKIVVDMLAMIEDGFSMVSSVSSVSSNASSSENKLGFDASVNGLISRLLRISVSTGLRDSETTGEENSTTSEKVHTVASLFFKLRNYLYDNNMVVDLSVNSTIDDVKPGDFVEVKGSLEKNPLIQMLEDLSAAIKVANMFSDEVELGNKTKAAKEKRESTNTIKQIDTFVGSLKVSGTEDFIMKSNTSVVLSVQERYLSDENLSEMIGGDFRVLGKAIQIYKSGTVNLLRKTSLALLPDKVLDEFKKTFETQELNEFKLPELNTEVSAPAIVMIPVAIFI